MLGYFKRAGVPPKRIVKEFPVTPDAHVPVGTLLIVFRRATHSLRYTCKARLYQQYTSCQGNTLMLLRNRACSNVNRLILNLT